MEIEETIDGLIYGKQPKDKIIIIKNILDITGINMPTDIALL